MTYLLDANVFIEAKNRHYPFDVVPGFWEWLDSAHASGTVHSIEKVRDELVDGKDDLADWAKARPDFFLPPDDKVVYSLRDLAEWAKAHYDDEGAINTFFQGADAYLVAHAHAHSDAVVTHEVAASSPTKIKIPNACNGMGVAHCQPFAMLQTEQARFVLGG